MSTSSSTPIQLSQNLLENFHPRKFLHKYPTKSPTISPVQQNGTRGAIIDKDFDANVIFVLSVLICSVISSLCLFCIVKCAMRCSGRFSNASNPSAKLAKTGVKKKVLKAFPTVKYTSELKLPGLDSACVICLSEFVAGEHLRILPQCNHGFHTRCIDVWLGSKSSCPTCRHCLTETDQETAVNCSRAESLPVQESV